jgi:hypothetical protein
MRFVTNMGTDPRGGFRRVAEDAPVENTDGFVCPVLGG